MIQTVCGPWLWRSVNCERTCKLQWIRSQSPSAPLSLRFIKQQEELLDNNEIPSASRKEAQQEISAKSQNSKLFRRRSNKAKCRNGSGGATACRAGQTRRTRSPVGATAKR